MITKKNLRAIARDNRKKVLSEAQCAYHLAITHRSDVLMRFGPSSDQYYSAQMTCAKARERYERAQQRAL